MRLFTATLVLALVCVPASDVLLADQTVVARLVQRLSSTNQTDRENAERDLIALGPQALDVLPKAAQSQQATDALDRIRITLEKTAAAGAGQPSTITVHGTLGHEQLAHEFEAQTHQAIRFDPSVASSGISVDWKNTAFWDAISAIERKTNSIAVGNPAKRSIVFQNAATPTAIAASSGPCRVEILSQSLRPNLIDSTKSVLHVRWRLRLEPRLRPLYVTIADRDCSLTSGAQAFPPLSPDARREFPIDRWQGSEIDTSFDVPKTIDATQLRMGVSGTVKVAARPLELVFSDLDQPAPAPRRRGAATGVVSNVDFNSQLSALQFDLKVTYDRGGPEFESHRMWIYQNAARLVRKDDRAVLNSSTVELKENAGAGATLAYLFENIHDPPRDFEFVYEAPSLVIDVPFKLENLRLPAAAK